MRYPTEQTGVEQESAPAQIAAGADVQGEAVAGSNEPSALGPD